MREENLKSIIYYLFDKYKDIGTWWPGVTRVEIMLGAVLTQLSKWEQVSNVLYNLKKKFDILSGESYNCNIYLDWNIEKKISKFLVKNLTEDDFKGIGFYKRKYYTIKDLLKRFIEVDIILSTIELRRQLLSIKGIGKETADCILCYGLDKEIFVVDEYTYKVLFRNLFYEKYTKSKDINVKENYKLFKKDRKYDKLRNYIEDTLKKIGKFDIYYLKNLHGAFVEEGKLYRNDFL